MIVTVLNPKGGAVLNGDRDTARLTVDAAPALRACSAIDAIEQRTAVAERLRGPPQRTFPENATEELP